MSDEQDLPTIGKGSPGTAPDQLDLLIREMFLRKELRALDDLDDSALEAIAAAEPFTDWSAAAQGENASDVEQTELPTLRGCDDDTVPYPGKPPHSRATAAEYEEMWDDFGTFQQLERISLPIECRRTAELGRGSQGIVYLVEGEGEFTANRALKVFLPRTRDDVDLFPADMKRIKNIASAIQRTPHDDLVDIGWCGECNGVHVMLMQYIDGFDLLRLRQPGLLKSLRKCVDDDRWATINDVVYASNGGRQLPLQPAIAVYIIERVLRGLGALHGLGIVHGDIKPSNIMLNASGSVKIIDIGSAFEVSSPPESYRFTPAYAAPEFLESQTMSIQSDLASAGYTLIELLSGKSLADRLCEPDESTTKFEGFKRRELIKSKQSLPNRLGEYLPAKIMRSNNLVELCRRLIDPNLNNRFPTAAHSIVDHRGTYEFNKNLIVGNLAVCNFHEVSQWLDDVKRAARRFVVGAGETP